MIITDPFYKATPSNNAPHLFCDDPLPELKHYDNDDEVKNERQGCCKFGRVARTMHRGRCKNDGMPNDR